MKTLLIKALMLALLLASLLAPTHAAQDPDITDPDIKPKFRSARWREVTARPDHLRLVDGRRLYRGPRLLRNCYPYYLAANADERAAGHGYELRVANAHRLLEPITTAQSWGKLGLLPRRIAAAQTRG